MKRTRDRVARTLERAEWQWLLVALGLLAIAGLLYAMFDTASEHMVHAQEASRNAPHVGYAPAEATQAARLQASTP
ncbi:hypothetical protein [Comamonas sp. GB3 AK4-5]|uniref:hypothetical protein n=1 Tax=Comamonas sp. GB3 AK4-5 TaxID=3231487 RepID=UPI00351EEF02